MEQRGRSGVPVHLALAAQLLIALWLLPPPGQEDLARRIALTYDTATDYQVDVVSVEKSEGGDPVKWRYRLAASRPDSEYCDARGPGGVHIVMGREGESAWAYDPGERRYVLDSVEVSQALRRLHQRFFGRFARLDSARLSATRNGLLWESENAVDELQLEPRRPCIVKSERRWKAWDGKHSITITWRNLVLNEPVPPGLFRFTPPAGARRTNTLPLP